MEGKKIKLFIDIEEVLPGIQKQETKFLNTKKKP
jgi:hypothetical protein